MNISRRFAKHTFCRTATARKKWIIKRLHIYGRWKSANGQACVVANELRRRGFDVVAQPNTGKKGSATYEVSRNTELAWVNAQGETPKKQIAGGYKRDDAGKIIFDAKRGTKPLVGNITDIEIGINSLTKERGRYNIDFAWKGSRSGHIISLERLENGNIKIYDPQNGKIIPWADLRKTISIKHGVAVLRVDDLLLNTSIVGGLVVGSQDKTIYNTPTKTTKLFR